MHHLHLLSSPFTKQAQIGVTAQFCTVATWGSPGYFRTPILSSHSLVEAGELQVPIQKAPAMCSNILCKQKRENMLIKDQRGVGQMKYTAIYTHNLSQRLTHTPTGTRHSRDCGRAPCWRRKASCWKVPSTCAVHLTVSRCSGAERRQRWPRAATARA